jgi:N-acetylglucosamine repressor
MTARRKPHAVAAAEDALLRCVRSRGVVARGELAAELGLVPSTIGVYVERLVRDGYLLETIPSERTLGRPPVLLELNPRCGRFIGIDFDARHVMGVAVDFAQRPIQYAQRSFVGMPTTAETIAAFEAILIELIGSQLSDVLGIGLGLPGYVDAEAGIALSCRYVNDWRDVRLVELLQSRFPVPFSLENNLRSMALAEYWIGQGRGLSRVTCLGVRTGIGLGVVIDGELYRGSQNSAGEIGSWFTPEALQGITHRASTNPPVERQTIEDTASVTAILTAMTRRRNAERGDVTSHSPRVTLTEFVDAITSGEPFAKSLLDQAAIEHAVLIHQVVMVLDPDRVILAGPLVPLPGYLERMMSTTRELGGETLQRRIVASELGPYGGAMGAASIAIQNWKPR